MTSASDSPPENNFSPAQVTLGLLHCAWEGAADEDPEIEDKESLGWEIISQALMRRIDLEVAWLSKTPSVAERRNRIALAAQQLNQELNSR